MLFQLFDIPSSSLADGFFTLSSSNLLLKYLNDAVERRIVHLQWRARRAPPSAAESVLSRAYTQQLKTSARICAICLFPDAPPVTKIRSEQQTTFKSHLP